MFDEQNVYFNKSAFKHDLVDFGRFLWVNSYLFITIVHKFHRQVWEAHFEIDCLQSFILTMIVDDYNGVIGFWKNKD